MSSAAAAASRAKKRAAGPAAEDAEVNERLVAIDIWVDTARRELEQVFEPAVLEMRRVVAHLLNRLSSRVKAMRMQDFLRECAGDVQALLEKDRRQQKMARTVARHTTSLAAGAGAGASAGSGGISARVGATVARVLSRVSRTTGAAGVDVGAAGVDADPSTSSTSSSSSSSSTTAGALPMVTPGHGGARSRIGAEPAAAGAAVAVAAMPHAAGMPAKTPSFAHMRSAVAVGGGPGAGGLGAKTPAPSSFLPKTPAPDPAKRARTKRRNEMVYHVAVSENGSPILEIAAPRAASSSSSSTFSSSFSSSSAAPAFSSASLAATSASVSALQAVLSGSAAAAGGAQGSGNTPAKVAGLGEGTAEQAQSMLATLAALEAQIAAMKDHIQGRIEPSESAGARQRS